MAKSVYDRIIALELPLDVQKESIRISDTIKSTHRKGKRLDSATFFAVYEAYRTVHKVFDPYALLTKIGVGVKKSKKKIEEALLPLEKRDNLIFKPEEPVKKGIPKKHINKILKDYYRSGFKPVLVKYEPHDFVSLYALYANISPSEYEHIHDLIDTLLKVYPELNERSPQITAAGVILYYAYIKGYISDKVKCASCLSVCTGWSKGLINEIEKRACLVDNP